MGHLPTRPTSPQLEVEPESPASGIPVARTIMSGSCATIPSAPSEIDRAGVPTICAISIPAYGWAKTRTQRALSDRSWSSREQNTIQSTAENTAISISSAGIKLTWLNRLGLNQPKEFSSARFTIRYTNRFTPVLMFLPSSARCLALQSHAVGSSWGHTQDRVDGAKGSPDRRVPCPRSRI